MLGLMMDEPLLLSGLIEHAALAHAETEIVARTVEGDIHRYTYADAQARAKRLAQALRRLGMREGDRVGSLAWNTHRHFEMFYGVTGIGSVLHTINPRLYNDQLVYIINHAEDRLLFFDAATAPTVEAIADRLTTVEAFVMMAPPDRMGAAPGLKKPVLCSDALLAAESGDLAWPRLDERNASSLCYTSGTTGNPKGVLYSHRANVLHTMIACAFDFLGGSRNGAQEVMMPMAPMFHGNAWNMPYLAPYTGSKLVFPGRAYEPDKLYELFEGEGVTITAGVPTMWLILLDWLERNGRKFSTLRYALSSGSAPPRSIIERLERDYGVELCQAWGMTEALTATKPTMRPGSAGLPFEQRMDRRMKSGRRMYGVELKIVGDDGNPLPADGKAVGHLRIKGPWIASGYFKGEGGDALDEAGWLKTGDVAVLDAQGHVTLTDRSKDVIKSGGEWISSIEIENLAVAHPDVLAAAVIAIPHPKWQERPLLIVKRREGGTVDAAGLLAFLKPRLASWWLPDAVEFVDEMPVTGTGKIHKLTLREQFKDYRPHDEKAVSA
ncbi:long-chain fatty acid--CoA ligase [Desertibaculum subflavum]|uniref:long-chain fatty acid--CoA ligase n=1 Tax=Desertibaculum subflavum TaxID=2268458 RepID=UPI000E664280